MDIISISEITKVDGAGSTRILKKERDRLRNLRIKELTDEYNEIYKEGKKGRLPHEMVVRAKEIITELKQLRVFRPRKVHNTK